MATHNNLFTMYYTNTVLWLQYKFCLNNMQSIYSG